MFDAIKAYLEKRQHPQMIDGAMTAQLKVHLEKLQSPIELVATLDDGSKAQEMFALLNELVVLSDKIGVRHDGNDSRKPSFSVSRPGEEARIRFAGIPMGQEFTSLVLALLQTGGHPPKVDPDTTEKIRAIPGRLHFETYITMSCHNCPDVVQALNLMAVLNHGISHTMIDGNMFKNEIDQLRIDAVPTVYLNGMMFNRGRKTLEEIITKVNAITVSPEANN